MGMKSDSSIPDWIWHLKNALYSGRQGPLTGIMGDSSSHHEKIVNLQLQTSCSYVMGLDNQYIKKQQHTNRWENTQANPSQAGVTVKYAPNYFPWLRVWQKIIWIFPRLHFKESERFNIVVGGHDTEVNVLAWCCDGFTQTIVHFCQAYNQILNCSFGSGLNDWIKNGQISRHLYQYLEQRGTKNCVIM